MKKMKSDDYKEGWREGYLAGFQAARDNDTLVSPNITATLVCQKCGIKLSNPTGYVCSDYHCPSQFKITC
jgi:hypothetical protein